MLRHHSEDLLGYLQRRVASREDAADLLAETLLQARRRLDHLPRRPPDRDGIVVR